MERILNWAIANKYRTDNPAVWKGNLDAFLPAAAALKKVKHHKSMPYQKVAAFMKDLRGREGITPTAIEFTILTACRTNEATGARWSEFDLDTRVWTILGSRTKTKKPHRVPLCDSAMECLERMKGWNPDWVFPGTKDQSISNGTMLKYLQHTMEHPFTLHGFRSTFRNWAADCTTHPDRLIETCLAHVLKSDVEAAYLHSDYLQRRVPVMQEWSEYLSQESVTPSVTSIHSKSA